MREKELQANLDWLLAGTENEIESVYARALKDAMRQNKSVFAEMQKIMDGPAPRHCVTDFQKNLWRRRKMKKLLDETGIIDRLSEVLAAAGRESVETIKRFGERTYRTARGGVTEQLEE